MQLSTLYDAVHNKDGSLAHSYECKMAFGRKDKNCPRCLEMLNGAKPRNGWQKSYYELKAFNEEMNRQAWKHHKETCEICTGKESGVCTFGDW